MLSLLFLSTSFAVPELAIVGLHADTNEDSLNLLVKSIEETGLLKVVTPVQIAQRVDGREDLILNGGLNTKTKASLEEGRVLYERADPDQAIPILEEVVESFESNLLYTTDSRDFINALVYLGSAHMLMGDNAAAEAAFRKAAMYDPGLSLNPLSYSPKIVELFETVKTDVVSLGTGNLLVESAELTVFVDGRMAGVSPLEISLPIGTHYLLMVGKDGKRYFKVEDITSDGVKVTDQPASYIVTVPLESEKERSLQIQQFYQSLGKHIQSDLILIGGITPDENLSLQFYSTKTDTFSKSVSMEPTADIYKTASGLYTLLESYLTDSGEIASSGVSLKVLPLDISQNHDLASMILNPAQIAQGVIAQEKPSRWYIWTGASVVVAGGTALTVGLLKESKSTVVFGPIP